MSEQITLHPHEEFVRARRELEEARALIARLRAMQQAAQAELEEAQARAREAVRNGGDADRALARVAAVRDRLRLLAEEQAELEHRAQQLERELAHGSGTLWQQNARHLVAQAEPHRKRVLAEFAALRDQVERLLRLGEAIEAEVAQAGGRPDHSWLWRLEQTARHMREVAELLQHGGAA